jgi:hypothetical protein
VSAKDIEFMTDYCPAIQPLALCIVGYPLESPACQACSGLLLTGECHHQSESQTTCFYCRFLFVCLFVCWLDLLTQKRYILCRITLSSILLHPCFCYHLLATTISLNLSLAADCVGVVLRLRLQQGQCLLSDFR